MRELWNKWKSQALPCETTGQKLFSVFLGFAIPAFFLICVLGISGIFLPAPAKAGGIGAATYNANQADNQNMLIVVTSNANTTICLADSDYTLVHLNYKDQGQHASTSTDYVVIMNQQNNAGQAVTMVNDLTAGGNGKFIVQAGATATFNADFVPQGSDGQHEIQLRSVGNGSVMQLIRGHFTPP